MRESSLYQRGGNANRPSEAVPNILPADAFTSGFAKEDGERMLDDRGKQIL